MLTTVKVYTVQAFSATPEGGNAAGVVVDTAGLSESQMLAIAAEVGFSETAFVLPSETADFRVRFFTPTEEVDLCGHATIVTYKTLLQLGLVRPGQYQQETLAGILGLDFPDAQTVFMEQASPKFGVKPGPQEIAASLNLTLSDLHPDLPVQVVSTGLPDVLVPVRSLDVLHRMQPDFDAVQAISERFDTIGYHVFSLETLDPVKTAHCRNLAPRVGIPEEAATGTANGALSAYLFHYGCVDAMQAQRLQFEQGHILNSPSEIHARLTVEGGEILRVQVGGTACVTGDRRIVLSVVSSGV